MDLNGCLRIHLAEHAVKKPGATSPSAQPRGFQFPADRAVVLVFIKINIVQQGL